MTKKAIRLVIMPALVVALTYGAYTFFNQRQLQHQLTLYGNVDIKEVSASFRVAGRLQKLFFDEGDFVKAGDLLAELESDTFANELELAKANVVAVRANLENAERKFNRSKKLFRNNLSSKQEYENDKYALEQLRAQFEAQQVKVKIAQTALNDTKLLAPTDAVVMTRAFEVGSMLAPNQTVYELSLSNRIYVRAYVDEKDLGKIANGMAVKIHTDGGDEYEGKIGFISPKAEFTPKTVETSTLRTQLVYRIRIIVDSADAKLKQGMPVTVNLAL